MRRVKELLSTDPFKQSLMGGDGFSLSFLSAIASVDGEWARALHCDQNLRMCVCVLVEMGSKLSLTDLDVPGSILPRDVESSCEVSLESFYPPSFAKNSKVCRGVCLQCCHNLRTWFN